ncbi:MAG: hypothetical protein IVW57_15880 [Ktedonobacterales bacterium]|nr:hypothetical protein [Ktedonobacterales bacterium]
MHVSKIKQMVVSLAMLMALGGASVVVAPLSSAQSGTRDHSSLTPTYSITYYDKSGQLQKTWQGSSSEQQQLLQQERAKHSATRPSNLPPDNIGSGFIFSIHR